MVKCREKKEGKRRRKLAVASNGKRFTVTRKMLTAVARHLSIKWLCVFDRLTHSFCSITNHLMTGPLEEL